MLQGRAVPINSEALAQALTKPVFHYHIIELSHYQIKQPWIID
jgi:hypothetical protein